MMEYVSFVFQCQCKSSESRTTVCVTGEGVVLSDEKCDASHKPTTSRPCETSAECERASTRWYTSEWSEVIST